MTVVRIYFLLFSCPIIQSQREDAGFDAEVFCFLFLTYTLGHVRNDSLKYPLFLHIYYKIVIVSSF